MSFQDPPSSFSVKPQTPNHAIRHKNSLEHVINFTLASPQPTQAQANEAHFLYHQIVDDCEANGLSLPRIASDSTSATKVYLHNLFRSLHQFSPSDIGRLNLVRMILHGLFSPDATNADDRLLDSILPLARTSWLNATDTDREKIHRTLQTIALDFLDGFFLPLTARSCPTTSVSNVLTPPSASNIGPSQGTPFRLGGLRYLCLLRDDKRCVVSGHLDKNAYNEARIGGYQHPRGTYAVVTEAAHIMPHSLNSVSSVGDSLPPTKGFVWQILNMFLPGTSTALEGSLIDTPANAILLATEIHDEFGRLRCYFDEVAGSANTYEFQTTRAAAPLLPGFYPAPGTLITFRNNEPEGRQLADLPSPRLLKLHAACCKMLEMAGAADYVDRVLDDMERMQEQGTLAGNGSSDIAMLFRMKGLGGWSEYEEESKSAAGIVVEN